MWYVKKVISHKGVEIECAGVLSRISNIYTYHIKNIDTGEERIVSGEDMGNYPLYGCKANEYWCPSILDIGGYGLTKYIGQTDIYDTINYSVNNYISCGQETRNLFIAGYWKGYIFHFDDVCKSGNKAENGAHILLPLVREHRIDLDKYDNIGVAFGGSGGVWFNITDKDAFQRYYTKYVTLMR